MRHGSLSLRPTATRTRSFDVDPAYETYPSFVRDRPADSPCFVLSLEWQGEEAARSLHFTCVQGWGVVGRRPARLGNPTCTALPPAAQPGWAGLLAARQ